MSASSTPTESPFALSPNARLAATVDLPTPPLPEATATIAFTPATAPRWVRPPAAGCGALRPGATACAVSTAVTDSTPGSASTAFSAALRSGSSRGPRSGSTSMAKARLPSRTTTPDTMPSETMSAPFSGSTTCFSASSICCSVAAAISFSCPAGQYGATILARRFLSDPGWARIATTQSADRVRGEALNPGLADHRRRRTYGIWGGRPYLTTPAPALSIGSRSCASKPGRSHPSRARRERCAAERFEVDVLAKSGRWPVGHRSAQRWPVGRWQPWQWRWARPTRTRPAAARFRRAAASRPGSVPASIAGKFQHPDLDRVRRNRRHCPLAVERVLYGGGRRGRGRVALWRLQSNDPTRSQLPPACADREGAHAERHASQPNRDRLPLRRGYGDAGDGDPTIAGRSADADR